MAIDSNDVSAAAVEFRERVAVAWAIIESACVYFPCCVCARPPSTTAGCSPSRAPGAGETPRLASPYRSEHLLAHTTPSTVRGSATLDHPARFLHVALDHPHGRIHIASDVIMAAHGRRGTRLPHACRPQAQTSHGVVTLATTPTRQAVGAGGCGTVKGTPPHACAHAGMSAGSCTGAAAPAALPGDRHRLQQCWVYLDGYLPAAGPCRLCASFARARRHTEAVQR